MSSQQQQQQQSSSTAPAGAPLAPAAPAPVAMSMSAAARRSQPPPAGTGAGGGGSDAAAADSRSKKQATHGQWRTPPVPFFPSGPHGGAVAFAPSASAAGAPAAAPPQVGTLPASSDDYAKALQEAYRRGAEAAAKMGAGAAASSSAGEPPNFDFGNFVPMQSSGAPTPAPAAAAQQLQARPQHAHPAPAASQPQQPQAQTPQHGPTQPPPASSAINAAASCPDLSNLGVDLDIDPTPVSEIKEKLRMQAVMEQQQAQHGVPQQYHVPPPGHQQVAHHLQQQRHPTHLQEPDPQVVTAQRQAAAAQSAQFPGLSPLQGPVPHPGSALPPGAAPTPPTPHAAPAYARSASMETVPSAAVATPAVKPPPPAATGVANPLSAPPQSQAPLPVGPMRIPGLPPPPGAPSPQAGVPPPGRPLPHPGTPQQQPAHPAVAAPYAPSPGGAPLPQQQPPRAVSSASAATAPAVAPSGAPVPSAAAVMQGQPRSVSLPDMSSYAARADAEEAKRRKRLARNRASARLRRLRKKNLVDSYEGEVGVLESSLSKLRSHRWGAGADNEAILDALSMERGQQNIDAAQRRDLIQSILAQQREQVANVMECQLENMVLGWIAGRGERVDEERVDEEAKLKREEGTADDDEAEQLAKELEDVLRLTPDQRSRLVTATDGVEAERRAIETVDSCLESMMAHSWLSNAGVEECAEQFMGILNPGQVSKFLLWTDHNSESIDKLDYVRAPPAGAPPQNEPTFVFGMDDAAAEGDLAE